MSKIPPYGACLRAGSATRNIHKIFRFAQDDTNGATAWRSPFFVFPKLLGILWIPSTDKNHQTMVGEGLDPPEKREEVFA